MFTQIPPFAGYIAWLGLIGYIHRKPEVRFYLPLIAGLVFLLGNLYVIEPYDPGAYYHIRYILPSVPLLIAALFLGAFLFSRWIPKRWASVPVFAIFLAGLIGTSVLIDASSKHLHNDVRNINEVQRELGVWLNEHTSEADWIAASDAGAVRYFSERPTLDLLGLNTPELFWQAPEFAKEHRVKAIVLIPSWLRFQNPADLMIIRKTETEDYTVTSFEDMARQVVVSCTGDKPKWIRYAYLRRQGAVICKPWEK
jgi:hypothetical protein